MSSLKQLICNAYLAVLFVVYPLFQHDHYYNMGENKYYFYLWSTIIFLVLLVIAIVTDPETYNKGSKSNGKKKNRSIKGKKTPVKAEKLPFKERVIQIKDKFMAWFMPKSIVEKFVWAYLVCAIISFIFGIDHYTGFWGVDGWHMGLLIQCLMIACFFAFAKVWEPNMWPVWCSMAGSSIVMILGIVMRFGIDPLGNYEGLDQFYIQSFVSTIGQSSWYSSYVCTVFPIGVILFLVYKEKKIRVISLVYNLIAFAALAIQDSDSAFLAIAGVLLVTFWVSFRNSDYLVSFFEILTLLVGSYFIMYHFRISNDDLFNGERNAVSIKIGNNNIYTILLVACVVICGCVLILNKNGRLSKILSHERTIYLIRDIVYICVMVSVLGTILFIALNTMGKLISITGKIIENNYVLFGDYWGNQRGVSWKACAKIFKDYSIFRKLFGVGPDSLAIITSYNEEVKQMMGRVFVEGEVLTCAHNEFYNSIIVYGLVGGLAYLSIFISGIKRYVTYSVKKEIVLVGAACIASYMGHNLFCYQTVICTPFILVIIGICEAEMRGLKDIGDS